MKLLISLLASALFLPAIQAPSPQSVQPVLNPVQTLFTGMAARDPAAIRAVLIPGATLLTIRDGKTSSSTEDAFLDRIAKLPPTPIEERIHDPIVHIDRNLAVVWAPFDFLLDGKVDHCGTDLFNLVLLDGQWRIASITWNSFTTCSAIH